MSLVQETVSCLDAEFDKLQLHLANQPAALTTIDGVNDESNDTTSGSFSIREISELRTAVRTLSTSSQPLLQRQKILDVLKQVHHNHGRTESQSNNSSSKYKAEIMWLLAGKATVQTFGMTMIALLERSVSLGREIRYWDAILASRFYTGLYTVQTFPSRLWVRIRNFYATPRTHSTGDSRQPFYSIPDTWAQFYEVVQQSIWERSERQARAKILSPFARCRSIVRQKLKILTDLRNVNASGIGILVEECLAFGTGDDISEPGKHPLSNFEWHNILYKSVLLMDTMLQNLTGSNPPTTDFEDSVFTAVENEIQQTQTSPNESANVEALEVIDLIICILEEGLPEYNTSTQALISNFGRPSRFSRYWVPFLSGLISVSTAFRLLINHKAGIVTWISEFGSTVVDFWINWVVRPTENLIRTIRHDEKSEIAIMSRNSLVADRASLERMVTDFVLDHPELSNDQVQSGIATVTANVREGDLTPVLRAYERDLRKPLIGTLRGDLIRALLIQIQKTKVDVEVAIGGIDALLKSQELVFGFVGLTPGILVSYATFRWIGTVLGNRKVLQKGKGKEDLRRALRNVDRILTRSSFGSNDILSYRDHGLLLCEIHIMSYRAAYALPKSFTHDFKEDMTDLLDVSRGVDRQLRAVSRMQWAYAE